ncbi:Trk system potassium transporter TrkA [Haloferula rosea]|uniref:Trk system potassium uptake protein TrkA n=1 Tax=Haloferula rosea TaxID=490093 RepID=A0A934RH45_9BACT|nr:Trk system potassium transporter TrkA [Haloferula rosea]MBK1828426.1 Trk system potassium transporter TrkA [Haloferula rosea]
MNIIIVGAGEIGRHLAASLSREAHCISVIENDPVLADELEQSIDAKVVCSDGTSVSALLEAGVGECDLFLALTSSNTANLVSSSLAKNLGAPQVVCRVHPSLQREEFLFDFKKTFGVDHLFSSERLAAIELAKFIRNPDSLVVEEIARGRIELQQVEVDAKSDAVGKALKVLKAPERTRVAMISRGAAHLVPNADSVIEAGDIVTIFGEPRKLKTLAERLHRKGDGDAMRVVIFGGGEYGFSLAQMLEGSECRVRIFEEDENLCKSLVDRLSNTTVIHADATVVAELQEEQVDSAEFFVATSPRDEDNVMSCLQAHTLGVKTCLSLIHRADYADAISSSGRHFGVQAAVSPRDATRREIERFLTSDRFHLVKKLPGAEILEMRVSEGSIASGHMVKEVDWPAECILVGLLHVTHSDVPGPDDVLQTGDHVYAVVSPKARKAFVKLLG